MEADMSDCVLDMMLREHIPLTRKNYLNLAYLGDPPVDEHGNLDAELEAELPEMFQKPDLYINGEEQP